VAPLVKGTKKGRAPAHYRRYQPNWLCT